MKKLILAVATAFAALSATAFDLAPRHIQTPVPPTMQSTDVDLQPVRMAAPARAGEQTMSIDYSPAEEPYQAVGFSNVAVGSKYGQAFEFTKENASTFAGNNITDIYFWTGVNKTTGANNVRKATVFLASDIDQEPFFTQEVELPTTRFTQVKVHLNTPYTIKSDTKVYVGFICAIASADDYPVVVDYVYHGDDDTGGWIGMQPYGSDKMSWNNYASQVGFVTIGVTIEGNSLPSDLVSVDDYFVAPVVNTNTPFGMQLLFTNNAANLVDNIDVEVTLGDGAPQSANIKLAEPLGYGGQDVIELNGMVYPTESKEVALSAKITKINGNANQDANNSILTSIAVIDADKSFSRSVVIEEFTGIWCGYCPVGIVAMEYIRENNNNYSYIPVAVHYEDALSALTFSKVIDYYCGGSVPSAVLNRWQSTYPDLDYGLLEDIEFVASIPAIATVTGTAHIDAAAKTVTVDTEAKFSFDYTDGDKNFILSFALTEDNVGPYEQHNYYSGTDEVPGWGDKGETVVTFYNDVARQLDRFSGIAGSVPATIKSGETYKFSHTIKAVSAITDLNNCNVVVYLTNVNTGVIENACWLTKSNNYGGVNDILADDLDTDAPAEYYNLQGIRVAEPTTGLYICRRGNTASMVLIK